MKIKLIALLFPLLAFSQSDTIEIRETLNQFREVATGLKLYKLQKQRIAELESQLISANNTVTKFKGLILEANNLITDLQTLNNENQQYYNLKLNEVNSKLEYERNKQPKRFGIGLIGGYGLAFDGLAIRQSLFIGIGLSYNVFRF